MKKVVICPDSGFCFGVKRAVAQVEEAIERYASSALPVYTLGPIVHNGKVVESLRRKGAIPVADISSLERGALVIRSHGVCPEIMSEAVERGFNVIDATCPFVKKIHNIVTFLKNDSIPVIVVGKKDHPEVEAIVGYSGRNCYVVNSPDEADSLPFLKMAGVVVQTTKTQSEFEAITNTLRRKISDCRINNTICFETVRRQRSVESLAKGSELMIISGARHSSNTNQLLSISSSCCRESYLVEDPSEVNLQWLDSASVIGLASGASTPIDELKEIEKLILKNL